MEDSNWETHWYCHDLGTHTLFLYTLPIHVNVLHNIRGSYYDLHTFTSTITRFITAFCHVFPESMKAKGINVPQQETADLLWQTKV